MNKENLKQIQKMVIKLLRKNNNKPLYIASKNNCSEMSRLVGCWIFKKFPDSKIYILKGKNIQNTQQSHDVLAIENNEIIEIIDPTIWQFFKNKKSILVKTTSNLSDSLFEIYKIYNGEWGISEILEVNNYKEAELKKIIALNILEN